MLVVATLSGVASVYTEWVMCHSRYAHESLHRQNMRLYAVGVALNGALFLHQQRGASALLAPMRGSHWVIVLLLAFTGLVTVRAARASGCARVQGWA